MYIFSVHFIFQYNYGRKNNRKQCRGQIYSHHRSSLLGENTEKILFLAYKIRLFGFKY